MSFRYLACIRDEGMKVCRMEKYVYLDGKFKSVVKEFQSRVHLNCSLAFNYFYRFLPSLYSVS